MAKEDFSTYKRWQKYILATHPQLPKGCLRTNLIAYCLAMAIKGYNGLGCYASDSTIGDEIGIANREVVSKYRRLAIDLGWFTWNGERRGRAKVLDIAIPADDVCERSPVPAETKHDPDMAPAYCAACQPLIAQVYDGKLTMDQLREVHSGDELNVPVG
jgi:hypothetical protein